MFTFNFSLMRSFFFTLFTRKCTWLYFLTLTSTWKDLFKLTTLPYRSVFLFSFTFLLDQWQSLTHRSGKCCHTSLVVMSRELMYSGHCYSSQMNHPTQLRRVFWSFILGLFLALSLSTDGKVNEWIPRTCDLSQLAWLSHLIETRTSLKALAAFTMHSISFVTQ